MRLAGGNRRANLAPKSRKAEQAPVGRTKSRSFALPHASSAPTVTRAPRWQPGPYPPGLHHWTAAVSDASARAHLSAIEVWKNPVKHAGYPRPGVARAPSQAEQTADAIRAGMDQARAVGTGGMAKPETNYAGSDDVRGHLREFVGEAGPARFDAMPADERRRGIAEVGPGFAAGQQTTGLKRVSSPAPTAKPPVVEAREVRPLALKTRHIALVGGFFDRTVGRIVWGAYNEMKDVALSIGSGLEVRYFTFDQGKELAEWIRERGGDVTVIGHSYGADTAASVVTRPGNRVKTLITLDPVGRTFRPDFGAVRANAGEWFNYNAVGGSSFRFPNFVAGVGGAWNEGPLGHATVFQNVSLDHAAIGGIYFLQYLLPEAFGRARPSDSNR